LTARRRYSLRYWSRIPEPIQNDMNVIKKFTERTGREGSITFGMKKKSKRVFTCNNYKGDSSSTESPDCDTTFGDSQRIGDAHTHPVNSDTIGILPSPADITSTVQDSGKHKYPQVSCITSEKTPLTLCYEFNTVPSKKQVRQYRSASSTYGRSGSERYYANNYRKDFNVGTFNSESGIRDRHPSPEKVIDSAFGNAKQGLRKDVDELGKDQWCQYTSELMGQGRRLDVVEQCKVELNKRSFLGIEF
jgi:hypothetical protein